MKEENRVKTWVKNHKKEIIIGVVVVAVIAGGAIIYIKSKNGNKIIAKVNSNKPKNDTLKAPNIDNNIKSEIVSKTPVKKDITVEKEVVEDVCIQEIPRLTKNNRKEILLLNDGFTTTTHFKGKNREYTRVYKIDGDNVIINETGKTSWADSHYDKTFIADDEEIHRFIRKNLLSLNTNISKKS